MLLPLHIAEQLQQLMVPGSRIPSSAMKHASVNKMLDDGLLGKQQISKQKALIFLPAKEKLAAYLLNHFGIQNLDEYIYQLKNSDLSRSAATSIAGNSKLKKIRSFKGFPVNCYQPVTAFLNGKELLLHPLDGSYVFISDYENFRIDENITVVGLENAENFRQIRKQAYLFEDIQPLFVCRYPQSNDLARWLQLIQNPYLHFGDLDPSGIEIYLSIFKKVLGNRASFFLPSGTDALLGKYGNRDLYNRQYKTGYVLPSDTEPVLLELSQLIEKHKKGLEQEIFINGQFPE